MNEIAEHTVVLVHTDVAGYAEACHNKSDHEIYQLLDRLYSLIADVIGVSEGRIVKTMGDAILIVLPETQARECVDALPELRSAVSGLLEQFSPGCRLRIHAHIGRVIVGPLGPDHRFDVVGKAVNDLFRMPWDGPEISADLKRYLDS